MIIGEGPGFHEDQQARPFVGPAGQLLDKMIAAMGLKREDVFLSNVVKCRPPDNRVPEDDEQQACGSNLAKEISMVQPDIIITVGMTASKFILKFTDKKPTMAKYHGKIGYYKGIQVIPTYHPAALLRNEAYKLPTWEDLQKAMKLLEEIDEREQKEASKGKASSS